MHLSNARPLRAGLLALLAMASAPAPLAAQVTCNGDSRIPQLDGALFAGRSYVLNSDHPQDYQNTAWWGIASPTATPSVLVNALPRCYNPYPWNPSCVLNGFVLYAGRWNHWTIDLPLASRGFTVSFQMVGFKPRAAPYSDCFTLTDIRTTTIQ